MDPFIHIKEYPFLICKEHQYACIATEVESHLRRHHKETVSINRRRDIQAKIEEIPGLYQTQDELRRSFRKPEPDTDPIPYIAPPVIGIRCNECEGGFVVCSEDGIKAHYRKVHHWVNPRRRGRYPMQQSGHNTAPWTAGVQCQRFFISRAGSCWFEISAQSHKPIHNNSPEDEFQSMKHCLLASQTKEGERIAEQTREMIEVADDRKEPNEWLGWVGWAVHLRGLDPSKLYTTMEPIKEEEEPRLALKWVVLERVMDQARAKARPEVVGSPALFEIQRSDPATKPRRPFTNRMEDDTWKRYKEIFRQIISIIERTDAWPDEERPPYRANKRQICCMAEWDDNIDRFIEARSRQQARRNMISGRFNHEQDSEDNESDESTSMEETDDETRSADDPEDYSWDQAEAESQLETSCLNMLVSWFDHSISHDHYSNVIISSLAVMGIQDDKKSGWVSPLNYTPIYSGVIKVARFLVLFQSWREWEAMVEAEVAAAVDRMQLTPGLAGSRVREKIEQEVRDESQSIFSIVRKKVRRFMTRTSGSEDAEPTPMDWIFEARAYGMKIRYDTAAPGTIDWDGDTVIFREIRLSMTQLSIMLRELVRETRELLAELTIAPGGDIDQLPKIPWDRIEDVHSNTTVGYSFLTDERNGWLEAGRDWVLQQIMKSKDQLRKWIKPRPGDGHPYEEKAVQQYGRTFEQCRERIFILMHKLSMPARSPDISAIRYENTVNGGVRNIFIHNGMVSFVTSYHKGFRNTGVSKIIHRYVPREVGELIIWFLWIPLRWWQRVQGSIHGGRCSPFMWADDIMRRETNDEKMTVEEKKRIKREGLIEESEIDDSDKGSDNVPDRVISTMPIEWREERTWTTDRIRRILTSHSERLVGQRITISAWRQIAVAIARRYIGGAFGDDETGGPDDEEDADPGMADDDPADLQLGHGSWVAGMIYARELQQATFGIAKLRDKFRAISRSLHRVFGFGDEDRKAAVCGSKRRKEPYESARDAERARRFRMMRMANIGASLRSMMGPGAEFRGQQEKVIQSIMQDAGPFIQITGTGGGKSLSFMLPAYCVPGGTTIVIVPLVSLRDDLQDRCKSSMIQSWIWQRNRGNRGSTIVFVTPESAVTKGFRDFVNGIIAQGQLDRVVMDECQVLLDSSPEFRPELAELGSVIREWGGQRVFLTATLPPGDMEAFFKVAALEAERTTVFRERTTRTNIQYRVVRVQAKAGKSAEEAEDEEVCELAKRWRRQNSQGRIMIYAVERERVDRLAARVGCPAFHSKVDTAEGKLRRLKEWKEGGLMIAGTKALGLGIDVPDVRLVLHAGMPYSMKDLIQESGRAGRDGQKSEAIVVCAAGRPEAVSRPGGGQAGRGGSGKNAASKGAKASRMRRDAEAAAYMQGDGCRRELIDRMMDGFIGREGCEEGEVACDFCEEQTYMLDAAAQARDEEARAGLIEEEMAHGRLEEARRSEAMTRHEAAGQRMAAAHDGISLQATIDEWAERCVVCWEDGHDEGHGHSMEACPASGSEDWITARAWLEEIKNKVFSARRFAGFSGCFECGMPQGICQQWEAVKGDEGKFRKKGGKGCQYRGLLAKIWGAGLGFYHDKTIGIMREMGLRDDEDEEKYIWMGRKVKWGGYETNNMCIGFIRVCGILLSRG